MLTIRDAIYLIAPSRNYTLEATKIVLDWVKRCAIRPAFYYTYIDNQPTFDLDSVFDRVDEGNIREFLSSIELTDPTIAIRLDMLKLGIVFPEDVVFTR